MLSRRAAARPIGRGGDVALLIDQNRASCDGALIAKGRRLLDLSAVGSTNDRFSS